MVRITTTHIYNNAYIYIYALSLSSLARLALRLGLITLKHYAICKSLLSFSSAIAPLNPQAISIAFTLVQLQTQPLLLFITAVFCVLRSPYRFSVSFLRTPFSVCVCYDCAIDSVLPISRLLLLFRLMLETKWNVLGRTSLPHRADAFLDAASYNISVTGYETRTG